MDSLLEKIMTIQSIKPISLIDVGARCGIQRPWDQFPENHLFYFGFEADAEECQRLNNKIESGKRFKYFPYALSNRDSTETLYLTQEEGRSSIYKPNYKFINKFYESAGFHIKKELTLITTTLNDVFNKNNIKPDFLKIDTQGSELKILKGANQYLDSILGLELEVEFIPIYEDQPLFHEVDSYVRGKGFELYDLNRYWAKRSSMNRNSANRGQIIFGDAIYFRSMASLFSTNYDSIEEKREKLLKIISIFSLYGFFDVAIEYLHHYEVPFNKIEIELLKKTIINLSSYPKWQKILFNSKFSNASGKLLHYIANLFSYRSKTDGWGTDYNSVDGRYSYHTTNRFIIKYFGRK